MTMQLFASYLLLPIFLSSAWPQKVCGDLVQGVKALSQHYFPKQPWDAWHLACQLLFLGLQAVPYRVLGGQAWGLVGGLPWGDTILYSMMACSTPCRSAVQSQC